MQISREFIHGFGKYVALPPRHEWQTPPGQLNLLISSDTKIQAHGTTGLGPVDDEVTWKGTIGKNPTFIQTVRESADNFRQ